MRKLFFASVSLMVAGIVWSGCASTELPSEEVAFDGGSSGGGAATGGAPGTGGSVGSCAAAYCTTTGFGTGCCVTPNGPCGTDMGTGCIANTTPPDGG